MGIRKNKLFYIERTFKLKTGRKGFQGANNKLQKWYRQSSFVLSVSLVCRLSARYDANLAGLIFTVTRQRKNLSTTNFTVVCLDTWPMTASEARGDLALIKTYLLFSGRSDRLAYSILDLIYTTKKQWGFYQITSSLVAIQRPAHWTDNCKMVDLNFYDNCRNSRALSG